jgi:hypothetical protein
MTDTLESLVREIVDDERFGRHAQTFRTSCPFCGAWLFMHNEHRNPDPKLNGPDAKPCWFLRATAALKESTADE